MQKQEIYKLNTKLDSAFDIFFDLDKFATLHPLISKVEKIDSLDVEGFYKIYEQPFAWLPFKINYKAKVNRLSDTTLEYQITEIPFTRSNFKYEFSQESETITSVKIRIRIKSILIGKSILMNKMFKAQDVIMNAINEE